MRASKLLGAALFPLLAWTALPQESAAPIDEQALARCVAEIKIARVRLDEYSFTKRITAEHRDKNGNNPHQESREYALTPRPDGRFDIRLLSVNGAPPSEKQVKEQEKLMEKEFSKSPNQVAEEKKKAEEEDTSISQDFLDYFDFKLAGREEWNGQPAFVLEFSPKAEIAELKDKHRKLLQSMAGRAWVSQGEFRLLCVDMHNVKSVKVWGGLSGVDHFSVRTEYLSDGSGQYLPKAESSQWGIHVGFSNLGQFSRTEEYSNFQKTGAKAPAEKNPS